MFRVNDMPLRAFQKRFLREAMQPHVLTAALSMPRGNGKSWLAAVILKRCLSPGDSLHQPGKEYVLCAASLEQARICFRFVREWLEPTGDYRFIDSVTRLGITHKSTNTKLRVMSSNAKTAFGIVGTPILVADEPGAWESAGGALMHDAISTAQGKPGSPLRVIYIGTLAPAKEGWWHDMIERGSRGSVYVQALQGDAETWDSWQTIRKANPLTAISPEFRKKLLEERDEARADSRLKARFLSYRLNVPTQDSATMLLTVEDWQRVEAREVPPRKGKPLVGVDLGSGRAWSAAVALWENGRVEALALAPGIPDLAAQEKRDRVGAGLYTKLASTGKLMIAKGLMVQPVDQLVDAIFDAWGRPKMIIADRHRILELAASCEGKGEASRRGLLDGSTQPPTLRALRKLAMDGPLAVEESSRSLLAASLSVATVKNDDQGNTRLQKSGFNNTARDDVAAALPSWLPDLQEQSAKAPASIPRDD